MVERISELLRQGITAARAGDREQARALLMRVVEEDERNEQAWLWLAGVMDDPQDVRTCLHNVLDLNPANQQARQGLAWVDTRYGPLAPPEPQREEPLPAPAPLIERAVVSPAAEPTPPVSSSLSTGSAYTGSHAKLASEGALSAVAKAHSRSLPPAEPIAAAPPAHPCLYCGAPTMQMQRACTQCRGDLMVRAAPHAARSPSLTILGALWVMNGVLAIIGGLLGAIGLMLTAQQSQSVTQRVNPQLSTPSTIDMLLPAAIGLLFGAGIIQVARALLRRERWAYYVVIILSALGFVAISLAVAQVGAMTAVFASPDVLAQSPANSRVLEQIAVAARVVLFIAAIFQIVSLVLVGLSYRDFFGPIVRFQPSVEPAEHHQHYNNGVTYKDCGMWYMAAQEWEAAVTKKPREPNYLHALGLAYAQLKQYDKARTTLDRALQTAPDNQQIKESRALLDQMAAKT